MPKNKDRYEIHVNGEFHSAKKTRRSANMVAATLSGNVEIKDTDPPKKKVKGEGFVMEQEVVDPYETQKTTKVKRAKYQAPVERMHQRGFIKPQQYMAAQRYYLAKMTLSGQTGFGMDYAKERVDTFGNGQAVPYSQLNAQEDLKKINNELTKLETYRLEAILIQEQTLRRYCLATFRTDDTRRQQKESTALKQSLTTLAILWGYENGHRANRGINQNVA
jgi:hypothetical protein